MSHSVRRILVYQSAELLNSFLRIHAGEIVAAASAKFFALGHSVNMLHRQLVILSGLLATSFIEVHRCQSCVCSSEVRVEVEGVFKCLDCLISLSGVTQILGHAVSVRCFKRCRSERLLLRQFGRFRRIVAQRVAQIRGKRTERTEYCTLVFRLATILAHHFAGERINRLAGELIAVSRFPNRPADHDADPFALRDEARIRLVQYCSFAEWAF